MFSHLIDIFCRRPLNNGGVEEYLSSHLICTDEYQCYSRLTSILTRVIAHRVEVRKWDSSLKEYVLIETHFPRIYRAEHNIPEPDLFFGTGLKHFQSTLGGSYAGLNKNDTFCVKASGSLNSAGMKR
jgi:hypothetical protein